ncbi:hypothetical protein EVG20_g1445 [Dentipellis fragilis]|uniref:CREG-like beta-barrel domain-containing protein n=1 Tax=Dentipellis fragilis TaxID=205917 RepID=A0A4Y9ZDT1_9AGAM|nr:hypothetical protein EVG20_g1445 [Dentipellis fragilis]
MRMIEAYYIDSLYTAGSTVGYVMLDDPSAIWHLTVTSKTSGRQGSGDSQFSSSEAASGDPGKSIKGRVVEIRPELSQVEPFNSKSLFTIGIMLPLKTLSYQVILAVGALGAVFQQPIDSEGGASGSAMRETVKDAGKPYSMQEYYANCHSNGSLTLILLPISRHSQNILKSPTHAASLSVWTNPPRASRARVSLMGNVTMLDYSDPAGAALRECYLAQHPDARWWVPGDDEGAHLAYWARFDPHTVYFVGGFGDSHYIGYVPKQLYQSAVPTEQADSLLVQN